MTATAQTGGYWFLDSIAGWQGTGAMLSLNSAGDYAVDGLPGVATPLKAGVADVFQCPVAFALQGSLLYGLDDHGNHIRWTDLDNPGSEKTLPSIGGREKGFRGLAQARGIAVLSDGAIALADTRHHQVKIFSPFPHALLAVWGSGKPSAAPGEFAWPWSVAAAPCGAIHVADRRNRRVQRIERDGTVGKPLEGFSDPIKVALSPTGTLAVVDKGRVVLFVAGKDTPRQSLDVPLATCLTFDGDGYLYVGAGVDSTISGGLVYKFAPQPSGCYRVMGIGVLGVEENITEIVWTKEFNLLGIVRGKSAPRPRICSIATNGSYAPQGAFESNVLDSGVESCQWHRIELNAAIPAGTYIAVATLTGNDPKALASAPWQTQELNLTQPDPKRPDQKPDCLVQSGPGQYLRFRLRFVTNTAASPTLHSIKTFFPRQSYLQYLPAIYQEDDVSRLFLERFLSIFQTSFDSFDTSIDRISRLFDPMSTPAATYQWLAAWLALPLDPSWSDAQRRTVLKNAFNAYALRGTAAGLEQSISDYAGAKAGVVEHFKLRQLIVVNDSPGVTLGGGGRLWSRDNYMREQTGFHSRVGHFALGGEPAPDVEPLAWGANEFSVFFLADPYSAPAALAKVTAVVEREKPAHTKAYYRPVFPRMRVGVQSTIGIDTSVGAITNIVLSGLGTLGYDSVLGCSRAEQGVRGMGAVTVPRAGVNSRLL
jgi:phage tail-like protein